MGKIFVTTKDTKSTKVGVLVIRTLRDLGGERKTIGPWQRNHMAGLSDFGKNSTLPELADLLS
jgi:hypothetical protein